MKLKNIVYSTSLAVLMLAAGSCKKEKFDINANPDDVTDVSVTPTVLLPAAQQTTSSIVATNFTFLQMWMGYWARSGSYQSLGEIETYKFSNDFQVGVWNNLYANANNYHIMMTKAQASGAGMYEAIGRIMKSHNFQILVDIYNNVPYFEAFRGTAVPTPKYDKGVDIYNDIFKQLDTAITLLKNPTAIQAASNPEIATADLVYAGNATSWIRFANTLRLRMLIHLHNGITSAQVAPGVDVAAQVGKFTIEGFIGAGQSAHLNPGFSGSKPQPYYRSYNTNESGTGSQNDVVRANDYAVRYYQYNGDWRVGYFYTNPQPVTNTTNASGQQVTNFISGNKGIPFGKPSGDQSLIGSALSTVRGVGYSPNGAASRAWIMTSVESLFLQAEAKQRGLAIPGSGTAKSLLTDAIKESFVWLNASRPAIKTVPRAGHTQIDSITFTPTGSLTGPVRGTAELYIAGNAGYEDVDIDAPGGGLYTILSQKWFALNGIAAFEIWTDYRRTDIKYGSSPGVGFDQGPPVSIDPGNTSTVIPRRLLYPQNEYNYNAANVGEQGTINQFTSKIFWDLN
ncbi:MAG: hypothetical protein JWP69_1504 [Flaviaesturariibacter sp.]|nr:hypothetical protein [Flaviaesturariibacter sp.]